MTRQKKLLLSSSTSLLYQGISMICGFILPRMFLLKYGSSVNGLVSSITQFLGVISLCELGVGAVVQSSLYRPLAEKNLDGVSRIIISSERFFKKISYILVIYVLILMIFYPRMIEGTFDSMYTILLILAISINSFAQYYFGMAYRLLLSADQLAFIIYGVQSITLVVNTICSIFLMNTGASIHIVKLSTSFIFLLQTLCLNYVAKKKYVIDRNIILKEEPIKQKWNGFAQHVAYVILNNTDTVVLTMCSTLTNVSIYSIYHLIVSGIKQIVYALVNGMQAVFGNMYAKEEWDVLNRTFEKFEWLLHFIVTVVFSITAFLIIPFVSVYTKGISDANYLQPKFAYMLTLAFAFYCFRLPYNMMVLAGHYKETQNSAIIEALLNISVSVWAVYKYGLIGVAIGTFIAMAYRTSYLAWYLSKGILHRKINYYIEHLLVDFISICVAMLIKKSFTNVFILQELSYTSWIILAIKISIACTISIIVVNAVCYKEKMYKFIKNEK